jgi:ArsR family transcriptional regulator
LFKAFSDETRLRLLNLLAQREHCVCEFQSILRVPQPRISRHLAYLRRSGLVKTRRSGKMIFYALAPATNAVHKSLLRCLRGCFAGISFLQQDIRRAQRTKPFRTSIGKCSASCQN